MIKSMFFIIIICPSLKTEREGGGVVVSPRSKDQRVRSSNLGGEACIFFILT